MGHSREGTKTEGQSNEKLSEGNPDQILNIRKTTMERIRMFYSYSLYPSVEGLGDMDVHFRKELQSKWFEQELVSSQTKEGF